MWANSYEYNKKNNYMIKVTSILQKAYRKMVGKTKSEVRKQNKKVK